MPSPASGLAPPDPDEPEKAPCYELLRHTLQKVTIVCCLACGFSCVMLINDAVGNDSKSAQDKAFATITFGFYIVVAVVLLLAEFEPGWLVGVRRADGKGARKQGLCRLLHFWPGRGIVQVFLGVQLVHSSSMMSDVKVFGMSHDLAQRLVQVFGWIFFGVGIAYSAAGLACMRREEPGEAQVADGPSVKPGKPTDPKQLEEKKLAYLRWLQGQGVPHLEQAIEEVESRQKQLQKGTGFGSWLSRKLGSGGAASEKQSIPASRRGPAAGGTPSTAGGLSMQPGSFTGSRRGTACDSPTAASASQRAPLLSVGSEYAGSGRPPLPTPGCLSDDEDEIQARRRRADEAAEAEYRQRYGADVTT